jgi:CBS domain-containing protein
MSPLATIPRQLMKRARRPLSTRSASTSSAPPPLTVGEVVRAEQQKSIRAAPSYYASGYSCEPQFSLPLYDPRGLMSVDRDTPLTETVAAMSDANVASVLVTAPKGRFRPGGIRGIFTERDYLLKVAATDQNPEELTVSDVMSSAVTCVTEDMPLDSCLALMSAHRIRRVPVMRQHASTSPASVRKTAPQDLVGFITSTLLIQTLARVYQGCLGPGRAGAAATDHVGRRGVGELLARQGNDEYVREKHTISHEADTLEMCAKMTESNVGSLVVMDGDRVAGVVSEREYVRKIATQGYKGRGFAHRVVDIMRPAGEVKFITEEETVEDAMLAMADHPHYQSTHRHLPVLAADGHIAGMLSIRDIKAAVAAVTIEDRLHSELQWRTDHPGLPEFMFAW